MEQKFNLTISKPCSETFSQFTPTDSGGFCNSCQKEVIDFRNMSDKELINHLNNIKGKTCGYFRASQLKTYTSSSTHKKHYNFRFLRAASIVLLSMISLHEVQAQVNKPSTVMVEKTKEGMKASISEVQDQQKLLKGLVSDESGPMPGVNIVLKGTNIGTTTNFDGEFEFPRKLKVGDVLVFSFIGYQTQSITIKENQSPIQMVFSPDISCVLMGEVDVNQVYKSKRTLWQKIKGIF